METIWYFTKKSVMEKSKQWDFELFRWSEGFRVPPEVEEQNRNTVIHRPYLKN